MSTSAQEKMLELFATSTDGEAIRRGWMQALMRRFDAELGTNHNVAYDTRTNQIAISDVFLEGTPRWKEFASVLEGFTAQDLGAQADNLPPINDLSLLDRSSMPKELLETFWDPCEVQTCFATNIVDGGRFVGHVSIFRTSASSSQFVGDEMHGEGRPWQQCTIQLMSATHPMFTAGPKDRGALLFRPDGTPWMQAELDVYWTSSEYRAGLAAEVCDFAASDELERTVVRHNTRIKLSTLRGGGEEGILVVVEPIATPRVTEVTQMTSVQRVVASYAARGATVDDIAGQMSRSAATVKTHLDNIYNHLGISTRAELAGLYDTAMEWKP